MGGFTSDSFASYSYMACFRVVVSLRERALRVLCAHLTARSNTVASACASEVLGHHDYL
jgi:hypothetical protein